MRRPAVRLRGGHLRELSEVASVLHHAPRVEHAVSLYRRGLAPKLIFFGGVGDFGDSEAEVSRRVAVSLGVPEADCLLEESSRSTAQNAAFTATVLRAQSLHTIVVTDPYHLPRAWWTLREVAADGRLSLGAGRSALRGTGRMESVSGAQSNLPTLVA